ncbi:MAG TPA: TQO small subunit DoxD [Solirubrobacterales bacterium]|nr:TQO small subunit DoxD [Solirubrobacterales bacterium]
MRKDLISPAMALFPLRLFLGITFVYAGVQKLSDPGFLHAGAPTYIGTQLHGFAAGTPGGFVLRAFALPHPELAGVGVALAEILIGLLVTTGLLTRIAAACGLGLNLLLFLTASWHTTPYFLGPDLVFTFAWLPLVLAGAEGQPALDNMLERPSAAMARRTRLRQLEAGEREETVVSSTSTRRALLAELAGAAVAIAGISALVKGPYSAPRALGAKSSSGSGGGGVSQGGGGSAKGAGSGSTAAASQVPSGAVKLGPGSRLPSGQAATYGDPADGSPDILIRNSNGSLKAFSAVCTHAGCTVGYQGGVIVCPCHGGEFSAETGEVIAGPPPSGLAPKKVLEAGGQIYAVPS